MSEVKTLAKETAIYGLSSILGKFLNWCLVPLYTYKLATSADYGIVTNMYAWTAFCLVILTYGMETGLFRFVNDERFAKSFVRGKVNQSGWGLNKIRFHLLQKGIAKDIIDESLGQTDEDLYRQRLIDILKVKSRTVKAENDYERKRKLAAYAMQKGFEASLVWEVLKDLDS